MLSQKGAACMNFEIIMTEKKYIFKCVPLYRFIPTISVPPIPVP
jgi:hypothetical protein